MYPGTKILKILCALVNMETSQFVLQSKSNAIKLKKKLELFQMSQKKKQFKTQNISILLN